MSSETQDRDQARRGRSLLSLSSALAEERGRVGSAPLPRSADESSDPVQRHRLARALREARSNPVRETLTAATAAASSPLGQVREEPAAAKTEPPPSGSRPKLLSWWKRNDGNTQVDALTGREDETSAREESREKTPSGASMHTEPSLQVLEPALVTGPHDEAAGEYWKPLIDPMKVIGGITRSRLLILSTTILGAVLGVAIALSTPKQYYAATELLIDPRNLKITDTDLTQSSLPSDATLAIVENQVRVLTSSTVLAKVVDRLKLDKDPEFNGMGGSGIGDVMSSFRSLLSRGGTAGPDGAREHTLAVTKLARSLFAERSGKTFVVVVGVTTQDPEKSALIANTMTEVFLETNGEIQSGKASRATEELTSRLDELRANVEAAERKVEAFKAENDIIDAQGRLITDDEIVQLNEQLSAARARSMDLNARAASIRSLDADAVLAGSLPEEAASNVMTELRSQYAALKQESDRLSVRLGPRHPQRLAAEAQLAGARDQIAAELRRIIGSVQTEVKRAVQIEQELASRLAQLKVRQGSLSGKLVTLRELEREATARRAVYEAFLLRARETGEQQNMNTANVTVISKAHAPLEPTGPSRAMIALTGLMLGLFAGIGLGGVRGAWEGLRENAQRRRPLPTPRVRQPQEAPTGQEPIAATPSRVAGEESASEPRPVRSIPHDSDAFAPASDLRGDQRIAPLREPVERPEPPLYPRHDDPAQPTPESDQEIRQSIEEIRANLREFREAMRELEQTRRPRRFF